MRQLDGNEHLLAVRRSPLDSLRSVNVPLAPSEKREDIEIEWNQGTLCFRSDKMAQRHGADSGSCVVLLGKL